MKQYWTRTRAKYQQYTRKDIRRSPLHRLIINYPDGVFVTDKRQLKKVTEVEYENE